MPSIDTLIASIRAAIDRTAELLTSISQSTDQTDEVRDRLGELGIEGRAAHLASTSDRLTDGQSLLATLTQRLQSALAAAEAARTGSAAKSAPGVSSKRFNPKVRDPERSAAIRRFGWPKRPDGKTSARGLLYDSSGQQVLHAPLRALGGNQVYRTPDLKDEWRTREVATSWHIEGGAAAYMRSTQTEEMSLWINVSTCGNSGGGDDPKRCHVNLPKILPEGYTLHVHMELEGGWYRRWTYHGTGEAVK